MGLAAIIWAAAARLWAARRSPSALVIVARFSRSAESLARHHPLQVFGQLNILQANRVDVHAPLLHLGLDNRPIWV
jgi:hypothetical protein